MKVCSIVGIRPQYIKMSILMKKMDVDPDIEQVIVNTGQHYDYEMVQKFFEELKIPSPNYNLKVGSGSHAEQTAKMLIGIEKILKREEPDLTLVVGDGNPTLAGALASVKLRISVGHVEAGLRSFNWKMVEEINRVLTDHCSHYLFTPTKNAVKNLLREGIPEERIYLTGDVTVDVLNYAKKFIKQSTILTKLHLNPKNYILFTLHRAENVDRKERLIKILEGVAKFDNIVFPIHPRTRKMIEKFKLHSYLKKMILTKPLGYLDFLNLLVNASVVVTDSGGLQKEAYIVGVPCVTVREETEWIETVETGANILTGTDPWKIIMGIKNMIGKKIEIRNLFGDGKASTKIIKIIKEELG